MPLPGHISRHRHRQGRQDILDKLLLILRASRNRGTLLLLLLLLLTAAAGSEEGTAEEAAESDHGQLQSLARMHFPESNCSIRCGGAGGDSGDV